MNQLKQILSINASEKKAAEARTALMQIKSTLETALRKIDNAVEIKYTGWMILLKAHPEKGWECISIVHQNNPPEDPEPEWDLCLPIPDPTTIPEFAGW